MKTGGLGGPARSPQFFLVLSDAIGGREVAALLQAKLAAYVTKPCNSMISRVYSKNAWLSFETNSALFARFEFRNYYLSAECRDELARSGEFFVQGDRGVLGEGEGDPTVFGVVTAND